MAGKSNKGKNRKGSQQSAVNPTELPVSSDAPLDNSSTALEANGGKSLSETIEANPEVKEVDGASEQPQGKQGRTFILVFKSAVADCCFIYSFQQ